MGIPSDGDFIQAPYICFMDYERESYMNNNLRDYSRYPVSYLQYIIETSGTSVSCETALSSLIQIWLFFGTLSEFFQRNIKSEFLDSSGREIFFQPGKTVQALFKDVENTISAKRSRIDLLARAAYATSQLDQINRLKSDDMPQIHLSLFIVKVILAELAREQKSQLKAKDQQHTYYATLDAILDSENIVRVKTQLNAAMFSSRFPYFHIMVARGWCPLQIAELAAMYDASSLYKLVNISRSDPPGQINLIESLARERVFKHQDCYDLSDCRLNNTSNKSYRFQHHHTCHENCASIGLDEGAIAMMESLLRARKMPVVKCVLGPDGTINLSIVEAHFSLAYIAISHVWADGLGNPSEHTLPKCQMVKIMEALQGVKTKSHSRLVRLFSPARPKRTIHFWMDVFCVPKLPAIEHNSYSQKYELLITALELMSPVYALAKNVLVLDSELRNLTLSSPVATTSAHFVSCRWMGRCWTLQEGSLASEKSVWYQIGVELESHKKLLKILSSNASAFKNLPFIASDDRETTIEADTGRIRQFRRVWNSFQGRATSKPEDAYIILANINSLLEIRGTDLNATDLNDANPNSISRMRAIILSQERIPMDFLCADNSEDPQAGGLNWIPKQPGKPALAPMSFTRYMRVRDRYMTLDKDHGTKGFIVSSIHETSGYFVFSLPAPWTPAHAKVSLNGHQSLTTPNGIYIFLQLPNGCHPLTADWCGKGACFSVLEHTGHEIKAEYRCSVRFKVCWCHQTHPEHLPHPVLVEEDRHRISILLDSLQPTQKLRRRYFNMRGLSTFAKTHAVTYASFLPLSVIPLAVSLAKTAQTEPRPIDAKLYGGIVFSYLLLAVQVFFAILGFLSSYFWRVTFLVDVKRSWQTNFLWWAIKFSLSYGAAYMFIEDKLGLFFARLYHLFLWLVKKICSLTCPIPRDKQMDQELDTFPRVDWSNNQYILGSEIADTVKNIVDALEQAMDY